MAIPMLRFTRFCSVLKHLKNPFHLRNIERNSCFLKYFDSSVSIGTKFSTSSVCNLKEVVITEENGVTVVEGKYVDSPRKPYILPELKDEKHKGACPLCQLDLNPSYTDVLILCQFLDPDGDMLPQEVTGLCLKQHRKVEFLVERSKRAGLMPNYPMPPPPKNPKWTPRPYHDRKYKVFYGKGRWKPKIPAYTD